MWNVMDRRLWRHFDFALLLATLITVGYGIVMINSATLSWQAGQSSPWQNLVVRQTVYGVLGLVALTVAAVVDYRFWGGVGWVAYAGTLALLALVLAVGQVFGGARGWFNLGLLPVQPAELAKVLMILALARYMSQHDMRQMRHVLVSLAMVALPAGLIYLQPDLGTALILVVLWAGLTFVAGARLWHLGLLALTAILAVPVLLSELQDYMRQRIVVFFDPNRDPLGAGYNQNQALIAVGSGGWLGQGYGSGTQSQLQFLRVRHTDYIFSVIAEELGFIGAVLLGLLLVFIIFRILRAAGLSRDDFGRLLACGVAFVIFVQAAVNIAVNVGLAPVTGLTLPFVSYGGSSLITLLLGIGLVESVVMRQKKLEF